MGTEQKITRIFLPILFLTIPFSLVISQLIFGIFILLTLLRYKSYKRGIFFDGLFLLLLCFVLLRIVSLLFSPYPLDTERALGKILLLTFPFFLAGYNYDDSIKDKIVKYFLIGMGIACVIALIRYFTGTIQRAQSTTSGYTTFSILIVSAVAFALLIKNKFLKIGLLLIFALTLLCTLSRSQWITSIIVLLLMGIFKSKRLLLYIPILILVFLAFAPEFFYERFFYTFKKNGDSERLLIWRSSIVHINKLPVFGYGPESFGYVVGAELQNKVQDKRIRSWNSDIFGTLFESGFIAIALLCLIWIFSITKAFKLAKESEFYFSLFLIFVATFISSLLNAVITDPLMLLFLGGLWGILISERLKYKINDKDKILLVRTDRIGDLILSAPIAEGLKKYNPACTIDFLVSEYASPIIKNNPYIDNIYTKRGFFNTLKLLLQIKPKLVIFAHPRLDEALAGFLAGIPFRLGTGYRAYSFLYNLRHYEHRKDNKFHEVVYNCRLLSKLEINYIPERVKVYLNDENRRSALELINSTGVKDDYLIIHPGSLGSSLSWKPEKFCELARMFVEKGNLVLITGSKKEIDIAQRIVQSSNKNVFNLAGKTDILTLAAIFERANLVIANSTGPLHLADAVGAKVLGIFPPARSMSPIRWAPYNQRENIIMPNVPQCERCNGRKCRYWFCMDLLSPEEVYSKAMDLIQK